MKMPNKFRKRRTVLYRKLEVVANNIHRIQMLSLHCVSPSATLKIRLVELSIM